MHFFYFWRYFLSAVEKNYNSAIYFQCITNIIFTQINRSKLIANFGQIFQSMMNHKNRVDRFICFDLNRFICFDLNRFICFDLFVLVYLF